MKLSQFRVRAYRCIHDTGPVLIADATTLIGKNESGKTAILNGLALLNKDYVLNDQDLCDELIDELDPSERIVEGRFEVSDAERALIDAELPGISQLGEVVIFRTKASTAVEYEFPTAKFPKKFARKESAIPAFTTAIGQLNEVMPEAIAAAAEVMKPPAREGLVEQESADTDATNAGTALEKWKSLVQALLDSQPFEFKQADSLFKKALEFASPYAKQLKSAATALDTVKKAFKNLFIQDDYQAKVSEFFRDRLHPRLLYFPDYKVIDGIISVSSYLATAQENPRKTDTGYQFAKAETVRNLFHLAQLDPKELEALATEPARLTSFLNRCSARLTEMLALTWKSKKIDVRLLYTNGTITVEVGDIYLDGTTKNRGLLDRRSAGFKWHFSFFVNFRAGIEQSAFKDAILLLDEPGLNLHPEQQAGLIDVIRELAETNQVIYTTHSPFMIQNFSTGSLLTVEFDPESKASRIRTNFWEGDWQTIRPILHAIGDRMLLRVFHGVETFPTLLIVEGATDQRFIAALSSADSDDDMAAPALGGAEPIPAGGHCEVGERAWFYFKRKRKVIALFDNEPDAKSEATKLEQRGFPKGQIIILSRDDRDEADIEDLFTEDDYLNAVNAFYGRKLEHARKFSNITKATLEKVRENGKPVRIVKALAEVFRSRAADGWGRFDKTSVCDLLCERVAGQEAKLSKKTRDRFQHLFEAIANAARAANTEGQQPTK